MFHTNKKTELTKLKCLVLNSLIFFLRINFKKEVFPREFTIKKVSDQHKSKEDQNIEIFKLEGWFIFENDICPHNICGMIEIRISPIFNTSQKYDLEQVIIHIDREIIAIHFHKNMINYPLWKETEKEKVKNFLNFLENNF